MPCKLAITSMSLGRCYAGHSFEAKLDAAQKYGYEGIELFHEDLADLGDQLSGELPSPTGPPLWAQLEAARRIREMCQARGIEILCLQPFSHYEGLLDREEHERRLDQLDFWFKLARELETDIIQVPASFMPAHLVTDDLALIVSDLRKIADLGLRQNPPIRFAYESLCWSTRVNTWEQCWEVIKRVNRPNFGMCLDTFNIAGRIYADPAVASGKMPNAEEAVRVSMARLISQVDVTKVWYVQVVDAERLSEPLVRGHPFYRPEQPARMSWSRNCRLFYGEKDRGAYLPIKEIAWAFFHGLGFEGWVSLELFNRRMADEGADVPEELAKRGAISWAKLQKDMGLNADKSMTRVERVFASL
ncbi:3-dehydroshikimate dehydratase [Staphylotrichum longicolle]|uniref:3-dehydroshikimate dehydratase n=1 Tax=Staphylotrichum longicolle TaxID=669026 RepID=A0AAD4HUB3_9PEZI|nr:3-dehydroshikimate dehydratase [Staphylotrichum longicolle]